MRSENWDRWLLSLPIPSFNELVQNYLGVVARSATRHSLIVKLREFLSRTEMLDAIVASLDSKDHHILALIHTVDGISLRGVMRILGDRWSDLELGERIVNLHERLLIYNDNELALHINPVLGERLCQEGIDFTQLLPSQPRHRDRVLPPLVSDGLLLALHSYLLHTPPALKLDGTLSKREVKRLLSTFPVLNSTADSVGLIMDAMRMVGLWRVHGGRVQLMPEAWLALAELSQEQRYIWIYSGAVFHGVPRPDILPVGIMAGIIESLLVSMDVDRLYTEETVSRILEILICKCDLDRPTLLADRKSMLPVLDNLVALRILVREGKKGYGLNRAIRSCVKPTSPPRLITSSELSVPPEGDLSSLLPLVCFFELTRYELVGHYRLTKSSFVGGRQLEYQSESLIQMIRKCCNQEVPQGLSYTIDSWINQINSTRLISGLFLVLKDEKKEILEAHPQYDSFVREAIADGVYLMESANRNEWESFLSQDGIGFIPREERIEDSPSPAGDVFGSIKPNQRVAIPNSKPCNTPIEFSFNKEQLIGQVDSLNLDKNQRLELLERINHKVILLPGQLNRADPSPRVRGAQGMEYQKKLRLIEQAIESGIGSLAIVSVTESGSLKTIQLLPRTLLGTKHDPILFGEVVDLSYAETISIPVRKISKITLIQNSFFNLLPGKR